MSTVQSVKRASTLKTKFLYCRNTNRIPWTRPSSALSAGDVAAVRAMYDTVQGFSKRPLGDTSDKSPALAFLDDHLFLAWKGSGNDNLSVMISNDNGA